MLPATAIVLTLLAPGHLRPSIPPPPVRQGVLLRAAIAQAPMLQRPKRDPHARPPVRGSRMVRAITIGAIVGGIVGGGIGYATTTDCRCDDPGYGLFLGLPAGALAGGLIGGLLAR